MDNFDELLASYKAALDAYIQTLRDEESLAKPDHSMVEMEKWDTAALQTHDTELALNKSRDLYKNALRQKNYGF